MPAWQLQQVCATGAAAANEPWPVFARREEVTITRAGRYTRVVLTRRTERAPLSPRPEWA